MNIIFLSTPAYGHVFASLKFTKALVKHGHNVTYFSSETFKNYIISTGAKYLEYGFDFDINIGNDLGDIGLVAPVIIENNIKLYYYLEDYIKNEEIDLIIHDSLIFAGNKLAYKYNISAISFISNILINIKTIPNLKFFLIGARDIKITSILPLCRGVKKYIEFCKREKVKITFDLLTNKEKFNIVFGSKESYPNRKLDSSFKFIGAPLREDVEVRREDKKNLILISLGTIYADEGFYKICIKAFGKTRYKIVMVIFNDKIRESLLKTMEIPKNIHICKFINQINVIKKARYAVIAGGNNSINECIQLEVPFLTYPINAEQYECSYYADKNGCGIMIEGKITKKKLIKNMKKLINNNRYKENCKRLKRGLADKNLLNGVIKEIKK